MSETNIPYIPASTSTIVAENETASLADDIKKYDMTKLIDFLYEKKDLSLDDDDLEIIRKEKVNSYAFLNITEKKLGSIELSLEPASNIAVFAKECKEKKLRLFSSYKTQKDLGEMLRKYGIDSNDIKKISLFVPELVEIDSTDKHFGYCITEIKRKMDIIGLAKSSNETVRCSYIEAILLSSPSRECL